MELIQEIHYCDLFDVYKNMLTDKQQQIFKAYYFDNQSFGEIAENCGVTRQAVKDILNRTVNILSNYEAKLNFYQKICETVNLVQKSKLDSKEKIKIINKLKE